MKLIITIILSIILYSCYSQDTIKNDACKIEEIFSDSIKKSNKCQLDFIIFLLEEQVLDSNFIKNQIDSFFIYNEACKSQNLKEIISFENDTLVTNFYNKQNTIQIQLYIVNDEIIINNSSIKRKKPTKKDDYKIEF